MRKELLIRFIKDKRYRFVALAEKGLLNWMPDKMYLRKKFKLVMGQDLDFGNPVTFNQKLQWLKVYNRNPEYTLLVDKYEAKKLIAEKIGEEYVIPTYGVWNRFDEIDFDSLPEKFVLKTTHDSGGVVICKNKSSFDKAKAKAKLEPRLKQNFYWHGREWPYKNVKPRIIAEKLLEDGQVEDYKVHCFNGVPKCILVCKDRFTDAGMTEDFFTCKWQHIDVKRPNHQFANEEIEKPCSLQEMVEISEKLAKDIPFVRTDFYSVGGYLYFGELTFYPASGFLGFLPAEYDNIFGDMITLPVNGGG